MHIVLIHACRSYIDFGTVQKANNQVSTSVVLIAMCIQTVRAQVNSSASSESGYSITMTLTVSSVYCLRGHIAPCGIPEFVPNSFRPL